MTGMRRDGLAAGSVLVFVGGAAVAVGVLVALLGARGGQAVGPPSRWRRTVRDVWSATRPGPGSSWSSQRSRWRVIAWCGVGVAVWSVTGWPVAGLAVSATGLWAPWLMGSGRVISDRLDRLEALEGVVSADGRHALRRRSHGLGAGHHDQRRPRRRGDRRARPTPRRPAERPVDQRQGRRCGSSPTPWMTGSPTPWPPRCCWRCSSKASGSPGCCGCWPTGSPATCGRAGTSRPRGPSPASPSGCCCSSRPGCLAMLAVVPSFAAPYATPVGQTVMALLLAGTVALLVWMRRLALGNRPPRFLGTPATGDPAGCLGRRGHSDEPPADAAAGCGRAHRHRCRRRRGRDQPAPARAGRRAGRARRADAARGCSNR